MKTSAHLPWSIITALALCTSNAAWADMALAMSKNCMSCHTVDKKVLGPAFKDVALKYKGDPTAAAKLATKIREGGGGVWGNAKMPANPQVSDAEAKQLAAWVLGL